MCSFLLSGAESIDLCLELRCKSEEYSYHACPAPPMGSGITIGNVTVASKISKSTCIYHSGQHTHYTGTYGIYGFEQDKIWVHKGCHARFRICYTDQISTTSSSDLTKDPVTTSSEQQTTSETTIGYGNGNESERQTQDEWIEDIPNAVVMAAFAILVAIVIALIVMGYTLWRKRYGRSRNIFTSAMPAICEKTTKWKNQNINAFITNQTQTKPTISTEKKPPYTTQEKQERYVNYLNMSQPLRLSVPVSGMVNKGDAISVGHKAAVKARLPPLPPRPPKPRNVYQNTEIGGDADEYLVPVTKGTGTGSARAGIDKVTRAVENDYQGIGQGHIYATIE